MPPTTNPTAATIYLRQSLDRTGEGLAVDRQERECRELCERLGFVVADVITDNDVSATRSRVRPGFERLLASKPGAIVVWHIDRLVRLSRDLERVIDLGVNVHAVTAGHVDLSTPAGRAVAKTITAWSQYEGEQKSARQQAANRQRARAGKPKWSARPFGFHLDGTHNEPEAEALRKAYGGVLAGRSLRALAEDLNASGFTTPFGRAWTGTTLRPVLTNPRNVAVIVYRGEEVGPASWEPIVDESTYRAATRVLRERGARAEGWSRARVGTLTGIAACSVCSQHVVVAWRGKKGVKGARAIYRCPGNHVSAPVEQVDQVVRAVVATRLVQPDAAHLWDKGSEAPALEQRVADLRQRVDDLADDYAATPPRVSRAVFLATSESLTTALEEAEAALAAVGRGSAPDDLLSLPTTGAVDSALQALEVGVRGAIITTVAEAVMLHPSGKGRRWNAELVDVWVRGLFGAPASLWRGGRLYEASETTDDGAVAYRPVSN